MSSKRHAALSNDSVAQLAAEDRLLNGESAVSAVMAGFFACAGAYDDVLLGPLGVLVAGVVSGARAFDGRLRQPGLGRRRPRGFLPEEAIPEAAYFAVPGAASAATLAEIYDGRRFLGAAVTVGIAQAQRAGAERRAALLTSVKGLGALAFAEPGIVRILLQVAGSSEGGLLTSSDLKSVPDGLDRAAVPRADASDWIEAPWASDDTLGDAKGDESCIVVGAVDQQGVFAASCFSRAAPGIFLPDLELVAPRRAQPVRRGVTRVAPGSRLPSPMPLAIRFESGAPVELAASPLNARLSRQLLDDAPLRIARDRLTRIAQAHKA